MPARINQSRSTLGGLTSTLGVARCGRSAGCVLCALWAVSAAVLEGGYPVGVSISSSVQTHTEAGCRGGRGGAR